MPLHADWKPLYDSFMDTYCDGSGANERPKGGPCRKGEQVFYAYCAEHGIEYTKPRPRGSEAFAWVGGLKPQEHDGKYLIRGRAIHPCKTYHPGEWPEVRVYLEEELKASAPTLAGKTLTLDHAIELEPPNRVLESAWEDEAVEYVAEVSKPIYDLVRSGEIRHVSVEYDWRILQKLDGIAPRRLELTGLSLLRRMQPGDPQSSVEAWEGVINKIKEMRKMTENRANGKSTAECEKEPTKELDALRGKPTYLYDKEAIHLPRTTLGEAVVEPTPLQAPRGYIKAEEILAVLPKDVPMRWGAGPHELVRRLRRKCLRSI